jgi:hypothetical protein
VAAKGAAAESGARATAAVAAADQALAARDQAVAALDDAVSTGERAADARDAAIRARDEALQALMSAKARIAELEAALETAQSARADAVDTLAARAEGAVVVLPGVPLPEAPVGPVTPASRVSWQPTWSEWANPERDDAAVLAAHRAVTRPAAEVEINLDVVEHDDIVLDDASAGEERGVRYLNVAATIAQLLPEDLGSHLMPGASVVRREGRLFATVAVPTNAWAAPGEGGAEQAQRFAQAGFKVEWTANAPLGV